MPPLSSPVGQENTFADPQRLFLYRNLKSDGAEQSITMRTAFFRNGEGLVGGNDSFGGFKNDLKSNKINQFAADPDSVTVGSTFLGSISRNSFTNAIMCIQAGTAQRELVQSLDEGVSWALINPPPGAGAMRTLRNSGARLFVISQGNPNINTSDNGGIAWTSTTSGTTGSTQIGFVAPDEDKCINMGGSSNFAISQNIGASPPVWTLFSTLALFGTAILIQSADWSDDSMVCAATGGGSDIMFSEDGGLTWTMIARDINPLRNAGSGTPCGVVFSEGNNGFYFINSSSLICFLSLDDMATPIKIDAPDSLPYDPGEQLADDTGQALLFDDGGSVGRCFAIPALL